MREGEKKTFKKKNIKHILGNIGHISGKVNEGDKIKKTFDLFKIKLIRTTKNTTKKKTKPEKYFLSLEMNLFFF